MLYPAHLFYLVCYKKDHILAIRAKEKITSLDGNDDEIKAVDYIMATWVNHDYEA